jgi:hypothetical protein
VRQGYRLPSPEIQHERPAGGVDHVLRLGVVAVDLPIILPVAARLPTKSASLTPLDHAVELHLVMPRPGATIGEPLCVRIPPVASSVACCAPDCAADDAPNGSHRRAFGYISGASTERLP